MPFLTDDPRHSIIVQTLISSFPLGTRTRTRSLRSLVQSGLKHAKDGDPVSDPKRVVAAANAAKQEKKAAKEGEKGELPDEEGEGDE